MTVDSFILHTGAVCGLVSWVTLCWWLIPEFKKWKNRDCPERDLCQMGNHPDCKRECPWRD